MINLPPSQIKNLSLLLLVKPYTHHHYEHVSCLKLFSYDGNLKLLLNSKDATLRRLFGKRASTRQDFMGAFSPQCNKSFIKARVFGHLKAAILGTLFPGTQR